MCCLCHVGRITEPLCTGGAPIWPCQLSHWPAVWAQGCSILSWLTVKLLLAWQIKESVVCVAWRWRNVCAWPGALWRLRMLTDGSNPPPAKVCNKHDGQSHMHIRRNHSHVNKHDELSHIMSLTCHHETHFCVGRLKLPAGGHHLNIQPHPLLLHTDPEPLSIPTSELFWGFE